MSRTSNISTGPIVNKVASSPLVTLDIEELMDRSSVEVIDLKDFLHEGLLLREKEFRQQLKEVRWENYRGKNVLITCSSDAIIPSWAYMLIVTRLTGIAGVIAVGDELDLERELIDHALSKLDLEELNDKKIVVKGCGSLKLREYYYTQITKLVSPIASSIMYGEPCSTVPIFKRTPQK